MTYTPEVGDLAVDGERQLVGQVMGFVGSRVQLRPVRGGLEWDARPEYLRPPSQGEKMSARVAVANARSRREMP